MTDVGPDESSEEYFLEDTIPDMDRTILMLRKLVEETSDDLALAMSLNILGSVLQKRYAETGAAADLDEAILAVRRAVAIHPDDSNQALYLNSLGQFLGDRYTRSGNAADLDEAIQSIREAVNIGSDIIRI